MDRLNRNRILMLFALAAGLSAALMSRPREASARVRLESICSIYGQKEFKLTGIGLVVGLDGTGDGGKNVTAMRALASALKLMNAPVLAIEELKDADNVAIVLIEATVPQTGLRKGQKIDCYVSSFMGAKSLSGGRLLVTPVETAEIGDDSVVGLASGPIYIEGDNIATTGKIPGGVTLEEDFVSSLETEFASRLANKQDKRKITLLLDAGHSSFYSASEVARVVNAEFEYEGGDKEISKAVGPGVVEVKVPEQYHDSPVEFVALLLQISIDNPHTQGRVVVNAKTNTVIITGEVEVSPVVVSHKNLTVEVAGAAAGTGGAAAKRFVPIPRLDQPGKTAPQALKSLVEALDQLQVPTADIISIIRELHRSGKLHAVYDEH